MNDRPSAAELLAAVEQFLEETAVPALEGPARFHARVAANVVRIVARELETEDLHLAREWEGLAALLGVEDDAGSGAEGGGAEPPASRAALRAAITARNQELVRRIRAGDADAGPWREALLQHLARVVADKLDVAQPPHRTGPRAHAPGGRRDGGPRRAPQAEGGT